MHNDTPDYNYLDLLNPQQRAAVVYKEGPALVIAGAGSGKTRVLTYKIVDLIRSGYEPYRILALTFTNKAAREMKERITDLVGEKVSSKLWMGTFHSIFLRILRSHADLIGYKNGFTIYDSSDSQALIKIIIKELGLDEKQYKASTIANIISNAKNDMIDAATYAREYYEADKRAKRPDIGEIFRQYSMRCRLANAMDFDDILVNMNILLRDNPDIQRHYSNFFRYILVDEYQDTNFAQHLIITQMMGENQHLCVVGDDAQSIYSFRGASITNILTLNNRIKDLKTFRLERNYRSTQNIVNAAGSLIKHNTNQLKKTVYSENDVGEPVKVIRTYSDVEEAYLVTNMISESKLTCHDKYDEYAILYRTNSQSRVLEEALRKRNIPYRIYGGVSFYQRKEIKEAICYFRLAINPDDDGAMRRVINYPARGIGETTIKKMQTAASEMKTSLWGVLTNLDSAPLDINSGTRKKLEAFRDLIQLFVTDNNNGSNAFELGQLIYNRTGILSILAHDSTPESISRQENLSELLGGLKDFVSSNLESDEGKTDMQSFLSEVSLATDQDQQEAVADEPKVTLMTVHAAKGLEFKHIYITGVEEELFPSVQSMDSLAQVEEERRLLYVAITRAKETCVISYAESRFRNGQTTLTRPSRFLRELDRAFVKIEDSQNLVTDNPTPFINPTKRYGYGNRKFNFSNNSSFGNRYSQTPNTVKKSTPFGSDNQHSSARMNIGSGLMPLHTPDEVPIGTKIVHDRFGKGEVIGLSESNGEPCINVDFGVIGQKKLILKFAKFEIVN